jgi:hypothetical protein
MAQEMGPRIARNVTPIVDLIHHGLLALNDPNLVNGVDLGVVHSNAAVALAPHALGCRGTSPGGLAHVAVAGLVGDVVKADPFVGSPWVALK